MSASIDKGNDGSEEDSREVLSAWLDDYIAGRCDRAQMHESFLEVCRSNPEAPWDALALLDQYQRRGRVDVALARSLKAEIAQLVFGVATQTDDVRESEATLDTTGSRWRKLYESKGSVNADEAPVEDPALRRDFDPVTRPPPMPRTPPKPRPAQQAREMVAGGAPVVASEVGVGTILRDRYELMEVMGGGRAGTVYQAFDRHRSHLPSPSCYVAVRVLQVPRENRESALADIERQAYEAQSLSHPNIVSVFDLDRHNDVYFVVMELLDGEPLSRIMQKLAGRPMSQDRALAVISAVGAALSHAHQRNIAHGDLKPDAVVLTTNGEVKVLDFGFARSHTLDQWVGGEPTVDGIGANSTAAYASAERVTGEEPTARDDVYSLACIAYELLSGRHPYGGRSAPLARAHGRAPQKISGLNQRQWHSLQNALNWNREERRVDVGELLAAMGCIDAPSQIPSMQPLARPSMDNPFGRGKGMLLAVLLVAAAGGVAWWQLPRFIEPARVSAVAGPAEVDPERPTPTPTASTPLPSETVATAPVASAKVLPESPAQEPPKKSPIVAATADPPPPSTTGANTAAARNEVANTAPDTTGEARTATDSTRAEAPRSSSRTPSVEFDKDTYVATESDAMVKLTVRRNGPTRGAARFRWALRANSAEAGSDYAAIGPGVEEVSAGSRTVTLTIPLVSDVVAENTELFLVELESLEGGPEIGEQAHAAVILVDDD
jgi:serine/threonine protein kinase